VFACTISRHLFGDRFALLVELEKVSRENCCLTRPRQIVRLYRAHRATLTSGSLRSV